MSVGFVGRMLPMLLQIVDLAWEYDHVLFAQS